MALPPALLCLILAAVLCACGPACTAQARSAAAPMTLDRLPILPRGVMVQQFSSHNKHAVNGDAGWHLYDDEHGDAVVVDVEGPGCLRSFWETAIDPSQTLKFYFDGEATPRYTIPALDLDMGKHPLFPPPLARYDITGHYEGDQRCGNCFVPIPFAKHLKISMKGPVSFHHFIVERYPAGTPVTTFDGKEDRSYLLSAFEHQGEELETHADDAVQVAHADALQPGQRLELLDAKKAGTVSRVELECDGSDEALNGLEIEMRWDDAPRPDVLSPVGIFFGAAVRAEDMKSLPTRVEKLPDGRGRLTTYFRMPFWRHGQIGLVNRMGKPTGPIAAKVSLGPARYTEGEAGYFCALYRDGRTDMGRDWLFCDAVGSGWFVGAVQSMFGMHYCEGDEHFTVDGAGMPQVNGTGSEDYYLACFWPNHNFNLPFSGSVGDITVKPGPSSYYRFHLEAPIPFYQLLDARIQHGGNSDIISHYRSVGFYYVRPREAMRQTDMIDVANEASDHSHGYRAPRSKPTGELESAYEGNAAWTPLRDSGRSHDGGEVAFTVAVDPKNGGVRLRRRLDQKAGVQAADVFVDGKPAGTWHDADQNPFLRWFDSDIDLPVGLTAGKGALHIRLVVRKGKGFAPFTDFRYEAFSYEERPTH